MPVQTYPTGLPEVAGIGLRSPHVREVEKRCPAAGWLEVHAENYMADGVAEWSLDKIRERYPLSIHGVGLSIGSAGGISRAHLDRLVEVCRRYEPAMVSEHLCWSIGDGVYLNDLLPVPHDEEALRVVGDNILRVQDALKRPILIENLATYVGFARSTMDEPEFLSTLVDRTGCGLLLDINNVYVSACNMSFDAVEYIDRLPGRAVGEIHLAGHVENGTPEGPVLIDSHGSRVPPAVWSLYAYAMQRIGRRPTLIEWDSELPPLNVLLGEAMWADMLAESLKRQSEAVGGACAGKAAGTCKASNCDGWPVAKWMPRAVHVEANHV